MPAARARDERGQASAELVAVVPALLLGVLIAAQIGLVGYALWAAGDAARTGARAALVGRDPEASARDALPDPLRDDANVSGDEEIEVRVHVPALIPGLPSVPLGASVELSAGDD